MTDNLKPREEYEKLFGASKNYYNPFTSPTIYTDKIKTFYQCIVAITNRLTPTFSEMLEKMKGISKTSESTSELKGYINQLLTTIEE